MKVDIAGVLVNKVSSKDAIATWKANRRKLVRPSFRMMHLNMFFDRSGIGILYRGDAGLYFARDVC